MKEKTIIIGICILLCLVILMSIAFGKPRYNPDWMIGKSPEQIQNRYGEFYSYKRVQHPTDGVWCDRGSYRLTASGIWGDDEQRWLRIYFKDGVADVVRVETGGYIG